VNRGNKLGVKGGSGTTAHLCLFQLPQCVCREHAPLLYDRLQGAAQLLCSRFFFLRRCTGNIVPFKNNWQNAFALPPRNISQWLQTQFRSWVVVKLVQNITVVQINEEIRVRRRAKEFQKQSCRGTHCSNGESGRKLSIIQNKKKSSVLQRLEELLRRFQAIARYFLMLERSVCLLQMGYAILHRTYVAEVGRGVGSQLWRRV
jgi:hypothetical protein